MFIKYLGESKLLNHSMSEVCYLLSSDRDFSGVTSQKAVLVNVGDVAECVAMLRENGIPISGMCSNDNEIIGRRLLGFEIWDIYGTDRSFLYVIPYCQDARRAALLRLLRYRGCGSCFIHKGNLPDFSLMKNGDELKKSYLASLELCIMRDRRNSDEITSSDYILNYMNGAQWYHLGLEWIYDIYAKAGKLRILDIGPGMGLLSFCLAGLLDADIDWIDIKAIPGNLPPCIVNVYNINIETEALPADAEDGGGYDLVIMTEVIEHFNYKPVDTLVKIKSYLKPGGMFLLTCPHWNRIFLHRSWEEMPQAGGKLPFEYHGHVYEYSRGELNEICAQAGFHVVRDGVSVSGNTNLLLTPATP